MKKIVCHLIFMVTLLTITYTEATANHAAGGEISYEWVSDSTYRIYFKFYRDCSGPAAPASVPLCYRNTCNAGGGTVTLYPITKLPDSTVNGSPVTLGCPGTGTKCTNSTSIVPGYTETWYTNTVTLPSRCNYWSFSTQINARNASVNLVNAASTIFYAEALLNNVVAQGNSSPYFSVKPVPSVCINQPYTYNNGGVDPNSDSLSFSMIQPRQTNGSCPATTSVLTYVTTSPVYNLTTNPIQTGNTFHLDSSNGQMTFTPTLAGAGTMTVRINEYRNGVWIGSVMRDIQVQVISCSVTAPIVNTVSSTISGGTYANGRVEACAGVPMSFCFDLRSSDTAAIIVASDNHTAAAPGSSVSYVGQRTDSVRGCFYWTPSTLDTGLRVFSVSAKDSTCVSPGVMVTQTFVLPIYIWPITDIIKDTTICYGDSVQLTAVGGSNFTWSVLSGGSPITTLSCTACKQPYARPLLNTQYVVNNSNAQYCAKNKDTVSVNVLDIRYDTISATSNSPVCQSTTLNLFATSALSGYGYKWTGPNSFTSTSQNPTVASIPVSGAGNYILRSSKNGCYSLPDTVVVTVYATPAAPVLSNNGPVCAGTQLDLSAQTVSGANYSWTGPNSYTSTSQYNSIPNAQSLNGGTYNATVTVNGCTSPAGSTLVVVKPKPVVSSYSSVNPTTCGGSNGSITLNGLSASTSYSVSHKLNGLTQSNISISSNASGSLTMSGLSAGIYSSIILTLNGCSSDSVGPITISNPTAPVAVATNNTPICEGDSIKLFAASDSSGVSWSWTGPGSFVSTLQNPVVLNAISSLSGTYALTATKNNCTSAIATTSVLVRPTPATPQAGGNSPLCSGSTLFLTSSNITGASYTWTGPNSYTSSQQNPSISNVDTPISGNYILRAILNGCSSLPDTVDIIVYRVPEIDTYSYTQPSTCGGTQGSITLKGLKSNTSYSLNYRKNGNWQVVPSISSNGSGDILISGLSAGLYSELSVTLNNCKSDTVAPILLLDPSRPNSTATNNTPICEGDTLKLYAFSDTSGVTWSWTGPNSFTSTSPNPVIPNSVATQSGTYTVVSIKNGCNSIPANTIVIVKPTPATPVAGSNSPVCSGGTLNLTSSAITGASYSWTGPNSYFSFARNPSIANVDTPISGRYIVTATINGCVSVPDTADVIVYHVPNIDSYSYSNPTTCGGTQGSISLKGLINNTTYTINYKKNGLSQTALSLSSNGSGQVIMSGLTAGLYTQISVTLNGCTSDTTSPILLTDPLPPVITAANNTPICEGDTLRLYGTSDSTGVTWSWTGPNSYTSSSQNPVIVNALPSHSGIYTLTATKNICTSLAATTTVVVHPTPATPVAGSNSPLCSGSTLNLTSSTVTGATYSWTGPNSYSSSNQNPNIANVDTPITGNYIVTATINGCVSKPDTASVIVYHVPAIGTYSFSHPTTCSGTNGSITLKGLKNNTIYTVNYKKNGLSQSALSLTSNSSGDVLMSGLTAGLYAQISVTLNGCTSDTTSPILLIDPLPPVITAANNTPICEGDTLKLFGTSDSSGVTWSWTGPNSYTSSSQNPVIVNALPSHSGIYTLNAAKNGCNSIPVTTTVVVYPTPATPVAGSNSPLCSGSTLNLTSSTVTGASYSWTGPNSYTSSNQNPNIANVDTPITGNYIVTATINGCVSEPDTASVIVYHVPAIGTYSFSHPTTCSGTQGSITLKGLKNNTIYTVNYKKNGLSQSALSLTSNSSGDVLMSGLTAGLYAQISVTLNGCTSDTIPAILLIDPSGPVITAANNTPICEGDTLKLYGTSDSSGVTWSWTGPNSYTSSSQNPVIVNAVPSHSGIYTLNAAKNGCNSIPVTTTVVVYPTPATPVAGSNSPLCSGSTLNLTSSTVTGASYSWTGPNSYTSSNQNPNIANVDTPITGNYIVTATINGCVSEPDTASVIVYHVPAIGTYSFSHPTTCSGTNGSITLKGLKNNTTYTVNYKKNGLSQSALSLSSNGSGDVLMSGLTAGLYAQISVTLNGCTSDTIPAILLIDPSGPVITAANNTPICEGDTLKLFGTSDSTGVTWSWTGPNSYTSSSQNPVIVNALPSHSGIYTLTASKNGCTSAAATTTVLVHPTPAIPTATNNGPFCSGNTLILNAANVTNASYSWTGPNSFSSSSQNPTIVNAQPLHSGTYTVIAIVNGCPSPSSSTNVTVYVLPAPLIGSFTVSHPTTCSGTDGSITLGGLTTNATFIVNYKVNNVSQPPATLVSNALGIITLSGLSAGIYTSVTITSSNGCTSDALLPLTLSDPTPPVIHLVSTSNPTTCLGNQGVIVLGGLNSTVSYTLNYTKNGAAQAPLTLVANTSGNISITGLTEGWYSSIRVTVNNCVSNWIDSVHLVGPVAPVLTASSNTPLCPGDTMRLFGTSDSSGVTWSWTGPNSYTSLSQNPVLFNAQPSMTGAYTVTATKNNCTSLGATANVVVNPTPAKLIATSNSPLCAGSTLNLSTQTVPGAIYSWTGPNSFISSQQNPVISNVDTSMSGNYIVSISVTGCQSEPDTTAVIVYAVPVIDTYTYSHPTTCSGTEGFITLHGLKANKTYMVGYWKNGLSQSPLSITSNGGGDVVITGLGAGTYSQITVTLNGCTSAQINTILLTDPNPPLVSASNNTPICQSDTVHLYASSAPGVTYAWYGPGSYTSTQQNPIITNALPTQSGAYWVTATIDNCTSIPDTTIVLVKPTPPLPVASYNGPLCDRDTLKLSAANVLGASYNWTGPNSFVSGMQNPVLLNATPLLSGVYRVIATVDGCVSPTDSVTVIINPLPVPTVGGSSAVNPSTCNGSNGSITLSSLLVNTNYIINYKKNGVSVTPFTLTTNASGVLTISGLTAGSYTAIRVTAPTGCASDSLLPIILSDPIPPSITLVSYTHPTTCLGNQGTITISGLNPAFSYTINYLKNGLSQPSVAIFANAFGNITITGLTAGTYTNITATINNCVSNILAPITLIDPAAPSITTSSNSPLCTGDTIKLFAFSASGVTYAWNGPGSFSSTLQSPIILNALTTHSGKYYVTATLNNCTSPADTVTIVVNTKPSIPILASNSPLCAGDTLKLLSPTIATASYLWSGPGTFSSVFQNPLIPNAQPSVSGVYTLVVTVNGCSSLPGSTNVTVNPYPSSPVVSTPVYYCQDDWAVPLTATGMNLLWYAVPTGGIGSTTAPTPSTVTFGNTTWFVSQKINGCESQRVGLTVTVKPKPAPPVLVPATYNYCQDEKTTLLNASGTGIIWYTQLVGGVGTTVTPLPSSAVPGTFKWYATQTGANGCVSDRDSATVNISPAIRAGIWVDKYMLCEYDSLHVRDTVTGQSGITYTWDFAGGTVMSGDSSGPYTISWIGAGTKIITLNISDTICHDSDVVTISVKPNPEASFNMDIDACVDEEVTVLAKKVTNATYQWSSGDAVVISSVNNDRRVKWTTSGEKTVGLIVNSENGCVSPPFSKNIYIHDLPLAKIETISRNDICAGDTISLEAARDAGFQYHWSGEKAKFLDNYRYDVSAEIPKTGFLYLKVTNDWECVSMDTTFITTHPCCDVFLPDAFTPNGDGKNDKFHVLTVGHHEIMKFMIVNRWGQTIFETSDENEGWDGTYHGKPMELGSYYYYLQYRCSDDSIIDKKGQVVLVR